jgi:hypothetical protein
VSNTQALQALVNNSVLNNVQVALDLRPSCVPEKVDVNLNDIAVRSGGILGNQGQ